MSLNILLFVTLMDTVAGSMVYLNFLEYLLSLNVTYVSAGLISTIYSCLQFISSPFIGSWSDNRDRKKCLVILYVGSAVCYILLGSTQFLFVIIISRLILGSIKHTRSLSKAYLINITDEKELSHALSYINAATVAGYIIGSVISGYIIEFFNFACLCWTASALLLFNAYVSATFLSSESSFKQQYMKKQLPSLPYTVLFKLYWDLLIIQFLLTLPISINRVNIRIQLRQLFQLSPKIVGFISGYSGGLNFVTNLFVGKIVNAFKCTDTLLLVIALCEIISLLVFAFSSSIWIILFNLIPFSVIRNVIKVCLCNSILKRKYSSQAGLLMSLTDSVTSLLNMFSPLIMGFSQKVSIKSGPSAAGILSTSLGIGLMFFKPDTNFI